MCSDCCQPVPTIENLNVVVVDSGAPLHTSCLSTMTISYPFLYQGLQRARTIRRLGLFAIINNYVILAIFFAADLKRFLEAQIQLKNGSQRDMQKILSRMQPIKENVNKVRRQLQRIESAFHSTVFLQGMTANEILTKIFIHGAQLWVYWLFVGIKLCRIQVCQLKKLQKWCFHQKHEKESLNW